MRGVSLKELQELLGHASLTMTMRYVSASFSVRACRTRGGTSEVRVVVGSPGRARTCDILINSQALYRLSYRGVTPLRRS